MSSSVMSDWNLWPPNQTVAEGTKNLTEAGYISVSRTGLWSSASSRRSDHLSIYHLFITISRADPTALLRNEKANQFYAGFVLVWPRVYLVSSSFLNRRASFVLSTMSSLKNHHRKSNINTIPTAVMKPPIICIILLPGLIILSFCPSQSSTSVSVVGWRDHHHSRFRLVQSCAEEYVETICLRASYTSSSFLSPRRLSSCCFTLLNIFCFICFGTNFIITGMRISSINQDEVRKSTQSIVRKSTQSKFCNKSPTRHLSFLAACSSYSSSLFFSFCLINWPNPFQNTPSVMNGNELYEWDELPQPFTRRILAMLRFHIGSSHIHILWGGLLVRVTQNPL